MSKLEPSDLVYQRDESYLNFTHVGKHDVGGREIRSLRVERGWADPSDLREHHRDPHGLKIIFEDRGHNDSVGGHLEVFVASGSQGITHMKYWDAVKNPEHIVHVVHPDLKKSFSEADIASFEKHQGIEMRSFTSEEHAKIETMLGRLNDIAPEAYSDSLRSDGFGKPRTERLVGLIDNVSLQLKEFQNSPVAKANLMLDNGSELTGGNPPTSNQPNRNLDRSFSI